MKAQNCEKTWVTCVKWGRRPLIQPSATAPRAKTADSLSFQRESPLLSSFVYESKQNKATITKTFQINVQTKAAQFNENPPLPGLIWMKPSYNLWGLTLLQKQKLQMQLIFSLFGSSRKEHGSYFSSILTYLKVPVLLQCIVKKPKVLKQDNGKGRSSWKHFLSKEGSK